MRCFNLILVAFIGGFATVAAGLPIPGPELIEITDASGNILNDFMGRPMSAILNGIGTGFSWALPRSLVVPPSITLSTSLGVFMISPPDGGVFFPLDSVVSVGLSSYGTEIPPVWSLAVGVSAPYLNELVSCSPIEFPCALITTTLQDVSSFIFPNGMTPPFHVWVAEVPEPSTALLLSAGIVGLAVRRRRARCGLTSWRGRSAPPYERQSE